LKLLGLLVDSLYLLVCGAIFEKAPSIYGAVP